MYTQLSEHKQLDKKYIAHKHQQAGVRSWAKKSCPKPNICCNCCNMQSTYINNGMHSNTIPLILLNKQWRCYNYCNTCGRLSACRTYMWTSWVDTHFTGIQGYLYYYYLVWLVNLEPVMLAGNNRVWYLQKMEHSKGLPSLSEYC